MKKIDRGAKSSTGRAKIVVREVAAAVLQHDRDRVTKTLHKMTIISNNNMRSKPVSWATWFL